MMRFSFACIMISFLFIAYPKEAAAMRFPPKEVKPIVHNGVIYTAPHWAHQHGGDQNGGYVEAKSAETGKRLWCIKVYEVKYDDSVEPDVQDIFITSLSIEEGKLVVVNEKNDIYGVDITTKEVSKLQ